MSIPLDYIKTQYQDLPLTIGGYTVATPDGWFTIILNQNLSHENNEKTYAHELKHILNGDFDRTDSVNLLEIWAHNT